MIHKRLQRLFYTLIATVVLLVGSCSNNVEDKNQEVLGASFSVEKVSAAQTELYSDRAIGDWRDIIDKNLITFKACLKDIAIAAPVMGQTFEITTPTKSVRISTDISGCLHWNEVIDFNFLNRETYYRWPVNIIGVDKYKGEVNLPLAVSPWHTGPKALRDMRHEDVIELTEFGAESNREDTRPLQFKNINLTLKTSEKSAAGGHRLIYELTSVPNLVRQNITGGHIISPLHHGRFSVEMVLIEKDTSRTGALELARTQTIVQMRDGRLATTLELNIDQALYARPDALIEAMLTFSPLKAPQALLPTSGILPMKGMEQNQIGELQAIENTESYVTAKKADIEIGNHLIDERQDDYGYEISHVDIQYGGLVDGNYNKDTHKTLRSNIRVCIVDPLSDNGSRPVTKTRFKVEISDAKGQSDGAPERVHTTTANGCLDTYALIKFHKFACEKYMDYKIHIEALEGRLEGIKKMRPIALNPWNPADFGYDIIRTGSPTELECINPSVSIQKVAYRAEGMDQDEFKLNRYLQLGLHKKYFFKVSPKIRRYNSYQKELMPESVTFGKFKVRIEIYTPKHAEIDYINPDLEEFNFLTVTEKEVSVDAHGDLADEFSLPFLISDVLFLNLKNLAVITLSPADDSTLSSASFAVPFFAKHSAELKAVELTTAPRQTDVKSEISAIIKEGTKLPSAKTKLSPLELYRREFKKSGEKIDSNMLTLTGTRHSLNTLAKTKAESVRKYYSEVTEADLRMLATNGTRVPNRVLSKLCAHFYDLPKHGKSMDGFSGVKDTYIGGENFKDCLKNPHNHIERLPMGHIEEILSTQQYNNRKIGKATLVASVPGEIARGDAFFAAYGDRSSVSKGKRESVSVERTAKMGVDGPDYFMFGISQGTTVSKETYEIFNKADMKAAFWRDYTQRELLKLEYNNLKLKFTARLRYCVAVMSKKNLPRQLHICEESPKLKRLNEEWFFIGEANIKDHGIIADANRPGDDTHSEIIRGRAMYNRKWNKLEKEDVIIAITKSDSIDMKDGYHQYLTRENDDMPFEHYIDNSFPGLVVPAAVFREEN